MTSLLRHADELKGARDSAQSLPSLRSELATSRSVSIEKEEECASLQAQLLKAEQTVQEVKAEILSLHGKLHFVRPKLSSPNECM